MNYRVLLMNGLNAAGNKVASFMNSQGLLVPLFPASLFSTLTSLCALFPEKLSTFSLLFPLLDLTPFCLNTILLCELALAMFMVIIVLLKCSQCSELNFNPTPSYVVTGTDGKKRKMVKPLKHTQM